MPEPQVQALKVLVRQELVSQLEPGPIPGPAWILWLQEPALPLGLLSWVPQGQPLSWVLQRRIFPQGPEEFPVSLVPRPRLFPTRWTSPR